VYFRRTPNATRIATAWLRRARETPGVVDRVKEFLEAQGDKKVRSPSSGNDVQISTLKSSTEPADQRFFQELLGKWSGGAEEEGGDEAKPKNPIGTQEKLDAVVKAIIEDAMSFGLTEEEARQFTRGLTVKDGDDEIAQVDRNMQRAIDKRVEENQAKVEAAKAKEDAERAAAKEAEKAAEAKRKLRTDTPEALAGFRAELMESAHAAGLPVRKINEILEPLVLDADADVVNSVKGVIDSAVAAKQKKTDEADATSERRRSIRDNAGESARLVAEAELELAAAKRSKNKAEIAQAKKKLERAEQQHRTDASAARDADVADISDAWRNLKAEEAQKLSDEEFVRQEWEQLQEDIERKLSEGAPEADIRELQMQAEEAKTYLDNVTTRRKEVQSLLAGKDVERNRQLRTMSKAEFDKVWQHAEKNKGIRLYNKNGEAVQYDPSRSDAVYETFMTLLGENIQERGSGKSDIDTTTPVKSDLFDESEADGKKRKKKEKPLPPTKSGRPRNSDGSSPPSGSEDEYGPGEFWKTEGNMWSGKNSKDETQTFPTKERAKNYAKTASTPHARVASRYLRGKS